MNTSSRGSGEDSEAGTDSDTTSRGDAGRNRRVRSFVRRDGRITSSQQAAIAAYGDDYLLASGTTQIVPASLFGDACELVLEIGAGDGSNILAHAQRRPEQGHIAVEVYRPGVGRLLREAHRAGLENLRVAAEDVLDLLPRLPRQSVTKAFVFFPDPWPKKRHHKRRLLTPDFFARLHPVMACHGRLYVATDDAAYAAAIAAVIPRLERWLDLAGSATFATRPRLRPPTRFEQRGIRAGHTVRDFLLSPL